MKCACAMGCNGVADEGSDLCPECLADECDTYEQARRYAVPEPPRVKPSILPGEPDTEF